MLRLASLIALFVGAVVGANYYTSTYGLVEFAPGVMATAGTALAGLTFALRDELQDAAGRRVVLALIVVGAALSYAVSDARLALASGLAFLLSELADFAVYTPLVKRGYMRAALASNIVGAIVDTWLFLTLAGFPVATDPVFDQVVVKVAVTIPIVVVVARRALLREPVRG